MCRPENIALLRTEMGLLFPGGYSEDASAEVPDGPCWVVWPKEGLPKRFDHRKTSLVFEQQRIPDANFLAGKELGEVAKTLIHSLKKTHLPKSSSLELHVFGADRQGRLTPSGRAASLHKALSALMLEKVPSPLFSLETFDRSSREPDTVLQCLTTPEGVWWDLTPRRDLISPFPGGRSTLTLPSEAPARSYLKIAEALRTTGWQPRPRQTVIDLGAAPGGWSYAFLERGCRVQAVDNGPMKISGVDDLPGQLIHLREDGLRFTPDPSNLPVDWLLSDMLVPPGVCLGLLKKWIGRGWMRRFIFNMKIPQHNVFSALEPIQAYLGGLSGVSWSIRQLYHDRREVTVTGAFDARPKPSLPGRKAGLSLKAPSKRRTSPGGANARKGTAPPTGKKAPQRKGGGKAGKGKPGQKGIGKRSHR